MPVKLRLGFLMVHIIQYQGEEIDAALSADHLGRVRPGASFVDVFNEEHWVILTHVLKIVSRPGLRPGLTTAARVSWIVVLIPDSTGCAFTTFGEETT